MSTNEIYQPINCDDYEYLEIACQRALHLTVILKNQDVIEAKARDLVSRKNVEYLILENAEPLQEIRLDRIYSFSHPDIGTITVSQD